MVNLLEQAGLERGRILEPGSGTGNFISALEANYQVTGVEKDPISAYISSQLYPNATIISGDFSLHDAANPAFDAVIGNVPFGQEIIPGRTNPKNLLVHNYFIDHSLKLLKPGGYAAFITSSGTSDSVSSTAREAIIGKADLVGAARLPRQAFRRIAGTDVSADVLIFRAREQGRGPTDQSLQWLETENVTIDDATVRMNSVFANNHDLFIGTPIATTDRFGAPKIIIDASADELGTRLEETLTPAINAHVERGLGHRPTAGVDGYDEFLVSKEQSPLPGTIRAVTNDAGHTQFVEYSHATGTWEEIKPWRKDITNEWVALLEMRDATVALRQAYDDNSDEQTITAAQTRLNGLYDRYVDTYGPINRYERVQHKPRQKDIKQARDRLELDWRIDNNVDAERPLPADIAEELETAAVDEATQDRKQQLHLRRLLGDPMMVQVLALEVFDEQTQRASKSQIFFSNPARSVIELQPTDSVTDALSTVMAAKGTIDIAEIARLTDQTPEQARDELLSAGAVFRDPKNPEALIARRDYLSGHVRSKILEARALVGENPRLQSNIDALESVLPTESASIEIRPGATWIPSYYYEQYLIHQLRAPRGIQVLNQGDKWTVEVDTKEWDYGGEADYRFGLIAARNRAGTRFNFQAVGVEAHQPNQAVATNRNDGVAVPAWRTFQSVLNLSAPKAKYAKSWTVSNPGDSQHPQANAFLSRKAEEMVADFQSWILADETRREEILQLYNETYNSYVAPTYDGSDRSLPGLGEKFDPYPYQRNAVERIVNEPGVLLNHVVGAGKTGTMLIGAAELRRLGIAHQPWIVAPNHVAGQISREALEWYPGAKVLSAAGLSTKEDRHRFIAQTTAGDWDLVIVPESVFERIPTGKDSTVAYLENELNTLQQAKQQAIESGASNQDLTVKQLNLIMKRIRAHIETIAARSDDSLSFEQTPCDYLFVDEAHHYKNLRRVSQVSDINCQGSQRSTDLDIKLQYLRQTKATETNPTPPVVTFATGTPISNNVAEIWVMMKFLRPDLAEQMKMSSVLGFASSFTKQTTEIEVRSSGSGLHHTTRTSGYVNVGELANNVSLFMDVVTRDDVAHYASSPLPTLASGDTNRLIEFEAEQEVKDFIADFNYRSSYDWKADPDQRRNQNPTVLDEYGRPVKPAAQKIDNALVIANDGKKVSLDPRLVNMHIDGRSARIQAVAEQVVDQWVNNRDNIYHNEDGTVSDKPGGLQIIFLDTGTPGGKMHDLYADIRQALAEDGMDPQRIAFVHDWHKKEQQLFAKCNAGDFDVIIGSTQKMGTGANMQRRAVALHHVDVPFKPAELEQREGRIIRQGNENRQVEVFNYVASGTYDAVMWQTLYRKIKFINQFYAADRSIREMDPLDESAAEAAAMNKAVATGDKRWVTYFQLEQEVRDLQSMKNEWIAKGSSRLFDMRSTRSQLAGLRDQLQALSPLVEAAQEFKAQDKEKRQRSYKGKVFPNRESAAAHLAATLSSLAARATTNREPIDLINLGGVDFTIEIEGNLYSPSLCIRAQHSRGLGSQVYSYHDLLDMQLGDDGKPNSRTYGLLSRLENMVQHIPARVGEIKSSIASSEAKIARLEAEDNGGIFEHEQELSARQRQLTELAGALKRQSQSPRAKAIREGQRQRMEEHGRAPGWTLDYSPTEGYAIAVHDTTETKDVIRATQINDAEELFAHGCISAEEKDKRISALTPQTQMPPATPQVKARLLEAFMSTPASPMQEDHSPLKIECSLRPEFFDQFDNISVIDIN